MPATRSRVPAADWTVRLCEECRQRRCMPVSEVVCRRCAPAGGPRIWRLSGLRQARLRAGLSAETLARRANLSEHTILRAESSGRRVQTSTAAALAGALQTSISALAEKNFPHKSEISGGSDKNHY